MRAAGFRVETQGIHWAIVERIKDTPVLIEADLAKAPATFGEQQRLGWYRSKVLAIIDQYKPLRAAVRYAETNIKPSKLVSTYERLRIEGVVVEALNSKALTVDTGPLASISARLGGESAKAILDGKECRGFVFNSKALNTREAIVVAVSSLEQIDGN